MSLIKSRVRRNLFRSTWSYLQIVIILIVICSPLLSIEFVSAAGATSNVHVVKYASDGLTVLVERTVSYEWMQQMLKVYGDGKTHYYHQGPIFEGDVWDPEEIHNLKDKGAVKGTSIKDLCDMAGGMSNGDKVMLVAVDGWHAEFGYSNIYEPEERQGIMTLCWYNGGYAQEDQYGQGYPGNNTFDSAIQLVFMTSFPNQEGKFVFGNSDMKLALPQEKYQHFYGGQFPSTNGLAGKWIAEVRIYSGGIPSDVKIDYTTSNYPPSDSGDISGNFGSIPWLPVTLGIFGILFATLAIFVTAKLRRMNLKIVFVLTTGILLIIAAIIVGIHPWQNTDDLAWELTLTGTDGQQRILSMRDIRDLPAYSGRGGFFTTVGVVYGPCEAKGVILSDLCQMVGGVTQSDIVMISASDGYSTIFDYDQIMGNFITYDSITLKEVPHGELKTILMYWLDGKALLQSEGKPLRIGIVGTDGLLTEGNNWVKWVNKIEILRMQKTPN
jgi:Oxidoreductase molybdopterin binding domain